MMCLRTTHHRIINHLREVAAKSLLRGVIANLMHDSIIFAYLVCYGTDIVEHVK